MSKNNILLVFGATFAFSMTVRATSIPPRPIPQTPLPKNCWYTTEDGSGVTCKATDPFSDLPEVKPQPGPYISPRTSDYKTKTSALSCGDLKNRLNTHFASGQNYEAMLGERVFHTEMLDAVKRRLKELDDLGSISPSNTTFKASMQNEISCLNEIAERSQFGFMHASYLAVQMLNKVIADSLPAPPVAPTVTPPTNWCGTGRVPMPVVLAPGEQPAVEPRDTAVKLHQSTSEKRVPASAESPVIRASN